jgi:hypothetical protein
MFILVFKTVAQRPGLCDGAATSEPSSFGDRRRSYEKYWFNFTLNCRSGAKPMLAAAFIFFLYFQFY